jgi:hypothetical protein
LSAGVSRDAIDFATGKTIDWLTRNPESAFR